MKKTPKRVAFLFFFSVVVVFFCWIRLFLSLRLRLMVMDDPAL